MEHIYIKYAQWCMSSAMDFKHNQSSRNKIEIGFLIKDLVKKINYVPWFETYKFLEIFYVTKV